MHHFHYGLRRHAKNVFHVLGSYKSSCNSFIFTFNHFISKILLCFECLSSLSFFFLYEISSSRYVALSTMAPLNFPKVKRITSIVTPFNLSRFTSRRFLSTNTYYIRTIYPNERIALFCSPPPTNLVDA